MNIRNTSGCVSINNNVNYSITVDLSIRGCADVRMCGATSVCTVAPCKTQCTHTLSSHTSFAFFHKRSRTIHNRRAVSPHRYYDWNVRISLTSFYKKNVVRIAGDVSLYLKSCCLSVCRPSCIFSHYLPPLDYETVYGTWLSGILGYPYATSFLGWAGGTLHPIP